LIKGNKVYGPDTCCFVPHEINCLFTKNSKSNLNNLPTGVFYETDRNKYRSQITIEGNPTILLGRFDTIHNAREKYCDFKENYIKQLANKYKDQITDKVYQILNNYKLDR